MCELPPDERFVTAGPDLDTRNVAAQDARAVDGQTRVNTLQQRDADVAAQEFNQITKFVAACRRQWPGAMIVLRPDAAPISANAPTNPETRTRSNQ